MQVAGGSTGPEAATSGHEGYLSKQSRSGGLLSGWTRRYVRLLPSAVLTWGRHRTGHNRTLPLGGCSAERTLEGGRPHCFHIKGPDGQVLLCLQAADDRDLQQWLGVLTAVLAHPAAPVQTST